jgi:acyl carrier protein
MKNSEEIKSDLRNWILKKNGKIKSQDLTNETKLLEARIISSLHIMELILEIEKMKGAKLNLKKMKPGVFGSVNSIYEAFFASDL